jgi:hypothetical protein
MLTRRCGPTIVRGQQPQSNESATVKLDPVGSSAIYAGSGIALNAKTAQIENQSTATDRSKLPEFRITAAGARVLFGGLKAYTSPSDLSGRQTFLELALDKLRVRA